MTVKIKQWTATNPFETLPDSLPFPRPLVVRYYVSIALVAQSRAATMESSAAPYSAARKPPVPVPPAGRSLLAAA